MKTQLMRHFAVAIGIGVLSHGGVTSLSAANGVNSSSEYQAPAEWSNFQRPSASIGSAVKNRHALPFGAKVQSVAVQEMADLPAPELAPAAPAPPPAPYAESHGHVEAYESMPAAEPYQGSECSSCNSTPAGSCGAGSGSSCGSSYGPRPISPWFGGGGLVFWNLSDGDDTPLVTYDTGDVLMRQSELDPDGGVGFETSVGRYFGCGQYGLGVNYMLWDPDSQVRRVPDIGSGLRFINPALTTVSIDRGAGATTVYNDYDTNAVAIQATRDFRMQGLEVNLFNFGLMGARRLGSCNPAPLCGGRHGFLGCRSGACGGATGPLARAASGRLRVTTSHGFRWFQLQDELEVVGDVDGTAGYGASDLYYNSDVENNLFGYQFGTQLSYCLGSRMMINLGGKMGVYGNDAEYSHRITTDTVMAYTDSQGAGAGDICTDYSDCSLAGLGELDLGLGYRLSSCWTISGGYRVLAVTGIATAFGQMPAQYTSAQSAGAVRADDSLVLHGAYIGLDYNW